MSSPEASPRRNPRIRVGLTGLTLALAPAPAQAVSGVFISEIHYDDAGTDAGEFVEVTAPAGTDLSTTRSCSTTAPPTCPTTPTPCRHGDRPAGRLGDRGRRLPRRRAPERRPADGIALVHAARGRVPLLRGHADADRLRPRRPAGLDQHRGDRGQQHAGRPLAPAPGERFLGRSRRQHEGHAQRVRRWRLRRLAATTEPDVDRDRRRADDARRPRTRSAARRRTPGRPRATSRRA